MPKVLVIGCGSIGRRHLQNIKEVSDVEVIGCRLKGKPKDIEKKYRINTVFGLEEGIAQNPNAVVITTPTSTHVPIALKFAEQGCDLFIEKPISHNFKDVDKLIKIINDRKLICMIGYNLRFHPNLTRMAELLKEKVIGDILYARAECGQYLPDWHPYADYRIEYSAKKSLGGGVILDLSHEIDYMRRLFGEVSEVFSFSGKFSSLEIETEDIGEILLRFDRGIIGGVHLDYVQRFPTRVCQIIGEDGTILSDFNRNKVMLISNKGKKWRTDHKDEQYDKNQMYIDEIKHFINCVIHRETPIVSEVDGKRVLEIVTAAKESTKAKKVISL